MLVIGTVRENSNSYNLIVRHIKREEITVLLVNDGTVYSAYKEDKTGKYSYNNSRAREVFTFVNASIKGCTAKNGVAAPFVKGTVSRHSFKKKKIDYCVDMFNGELAGMNVTGENISIYAEYLDKDIIPKDINYVKLTVAKEFNTEEGSEGFNLPVRSLEEIALEKDLSWLKKKYYYIVNDDETAEKIFSVLDKFDGPISLDYETTGLRINMFSKVNSKEQKMLEEYNNTNEEKIQADSLVGIIFCVEENISYYFPVANRKFKNLYEDKNSEIRKRTIEFIKEQKLIDDPLCKTDMGKLLRDTPEDDLAPDVIAMERIRRIVETKHIVPHGGSFEYKVGLCYDIDTNIKDDTLILHQVMYKFRSTTSNRGEPSNLKYLTKTEFGIDQLDLKDFFVDYVEDSDGTAKGKKGKGKKKKAKIDFSFMEYEGARAYGPADGDFTLGLFYKYKRDMMDNHKELEYIYNVEVIVEMAIGYMEFYGHRIDESKIEEALNYAIAKMKEMEQEIRKMAGLKEDEELNLNSPAQVAVLFYDKLQLPFSGEKYSVADKVIKQYLNLKNEDGSDKYPVVKLYKDWKALSTLVSKFFGNLTDFMYPGGFIFSSFGQITTATGRMSCKKPNAQQYPDEIKAIVCPRDKFVMLDSDYSQIEYRTLVALAMEIAFLEMFKDPDVDYHTLKASQMYDVLYASVKEAMRSDAKKFNFGIPYGMGLKSLAILLFGRAGASEREQAAIKYELYFKDQPRVKKFFDEVKEMALINKFTKTFFNRYRYYSFVDKDGNASNAKKAAALRQAGNAVIQGTAADIFKIGVARTFMYIRDRKLFGKLLITNMIHDEQLLEVNCEELNTQRILRDITNCMSFKIEGFPPLYVGAGFGMTWKKAKGGMAEIHPHLLAQLSEEVEGVSAFSANDMAPEDVVKYFDDRNFTFRRDKIKNYIVNEDNWGKDLHPAVGKLINMQFTYGLDKEYSGEELTVRATHEFIQRECPGVDYKLFSKAAEVEEYKDETEYEDNEDEMELLDNDIEDTSFALVDEDMELFEIPLQDIISEFGLFISKEKRVCGIDTRIMSHSKRDKLVEYLNSKVCESEHEGSMQIIFLKDNNVLLETGVYVGDIEGSAVAARLKLNTLVY